MGKSGGSSGGTQVIQAPRPSIPNEELLQSSGLWRLHASSPYYSSPWRTMDFMQSYYAPSMQLPQFTNPAASQPWGLVNPSQSQQPQQGAPMNQAQPNLVQGSGMSGKGMVNPGVGGASFKPGVQAQSPQPTPASPTKTPEASLGRPDLNQGVMQR